MAQVLIRDLDDKVLKALKRRAARNHRSLQGELKLILEQSAGYRSAALEADLRKLRESLGGKLLGDSAELIRENRDGIKNDLIPGSGARRRKVAPTGSVWNWLKRRPVGNLTKEEIDAYIRAERESWGAP